PGLSGFWFCPSDGTEIKTIRFRRCKRDDECFQRGEIKKVAPKKGHLLKIYDEILITGCFVARQTAYPQFYTLYFLSRPQFPGSSNHQETHKKFRRSS